MNLPIRARSSWLLVGALLILPMLAISAHAGQQIVRGYTMDFPWQQFRALPTWLDRPGSDEGQALGTLRIPLTPPPGYDLAVTVFFDDPGEGFLRAIWTSSTAETTLSQNLYEGTGNPHQRTLLLRESLLATPGFLTLQSSQSRLPVGRIRFEWVAEEPILASASATLPGLLQGEGQLLSESEISGEPYTAGTDNWRGEVVSAPLSENVERLNQGVSFTAEIERDPAQARLSVLISCPDVNRVFAAYVNGQYAGVVAVEIPDLADPGYIRQGDGSIIYAGWRKGTVSVPANLLSKGENLVEFLWGGDRSTPAVAIRDLVAQLRYPPGSFFSPAPTDPPIQFLGTAPDLIPEPPSP